MALTESSAILVEEDATGYIEWGPIIAGALAAAALSFVLHAFAAAIGLAVSSTAPTWRDSSAFLQALSGLYLVFTAVVALGLGGYLAGRMRTPLDATAEEMHFRDGTHGLVVWAIALVLTVLMAWLTAQSLARLAAPAGGPQGSAQAVAGENIIAYELDHLFRAERRPENVDLSYARSEAGRILLTSAGPTGVSADDRGYLARLTANTTGLAAPEAEQRVQTIISQARENIRKARRSAVILAFMAGAAALLGAAIAWHAARAGGEHRDRRSTAPYPWLLTSARN
jgi:hypothetical protein